MHRNYQLLFVLIALVITSLALGLSSGGDGRADFRVDLFQVKDTAAIQSIEILRDEEVTLTRRSTGTGWQVNGSVEVNRNLKNVLLAVLNQVNVRRPVSRVQQQEIVATLLEANLVRVDRGTDVLEFYAGGNAARTLSYFMLKGSEEPYIMEIPGYRNYVTGIFELSPYQWRDRTLFSTHWRSLQALYVSYPGNQAEDVKIFFQDDFFQIDGVSRMDTTRLMNYLAGFELFEANEFIPAGFSAAYDSLAETSPLAIVELKEINQERNQRLRVYPKLDNDNYMLTADKGGNLSLVSFDRIRNLLPQKADFQR